MTYYGKNRLLARKKFTLRLSHASDDDEVPWLGFGNESGRESSGMSLSSDSVSASRSFCAAGT